MKFKSLSILMLCISGLAFSQSNFTYAQCVISKNKYVITNFLKQNPNHPKAKVLQEMLVQINAGGEVNAPEYIRSSNFTPSGSFVISNNNNIRKAEFLGTATDMPEATPAVTGSANTIATTESSESAANKLNYLLNDNKNSNMAFIAIKNESNCPINVSIKGPKAYTVSIPAMGDNNILVEKGTYQFNSKICKARYKKKKEVNGDIQITLKD